MKKILIVFAVVFAAFAVEAQGPRRPSGVGPAQQSRGQMVRPENRGGGRNMRARRNMDGDGRLSSQDQHLLESIEGTDSPQAARRYLQSAISSRSEEVRMAMVNALENGDRRSASDLAYFIADPSEDVSEAAFTAWTTALSDARGDQRVRAILEAAQILQGRSNGQWQGHGAPAAPMVAPSTVPPPAAR